MKVLQNNFSDGSSRLSRSALRARLLAAKAKTNFMQFQLQTTVIIGGRVQSKTLQTNSEILAELDRRKAMGFCLTDEERQLREQLNWYFTAKKN